MKTKFTFHAGKDIYHRYCSDLQAKGSMGGELLGISMLYKVWNDQICGYSRGEQIVHLLLSNYDIPVLSIIVV